MTASSSPPQASWTDATVLEPGDAMVAAMAAAGVEYLFFTSGSELAFYQEAIAKADRDWFSLNSSREQLMLLGQLGFQSENVQAGIATFDRALLRLSPPEEAWQPRRVFLFSGHMVDKPGRAEPRFPPALVPAAAARLAEELEKLEAGPEDLAFSQASAGGDLLFVEACQKRGVKCRIRLPFDEPKFIAESITPSTDGAAWRDRYYEAVGKLEKDALRIMPEQLGPLPDGVSEYERCNLWLLYSAMSCGIDKVRFVCLWNGARGDGPGGTAHMYDSVNSRTGRVTWIDTRELAPKASAAGGAAT